MVTVIDMETGEIIGQRVQENDLPDRWLASSRCDCLPRLATVALESPPSASVELPPDLASVDSSRFLAAID